MTLAEAGLRLPRENAPYFMLPSGIEPEVKAILASLPYATADWVKAEAKRIMGGRDTFVPVEKSDTSKYSNVVKFYEKLLATYAPNLSGKSFALYAVSANDVPQTFLLPEFFNLNNTQQAFILIHEANVRGRPNSVVPFALRLDGIIYDFFTHSANADALEYYIALKDLTQAMGKRDPDAGYHLFEWIVREFGKKAGRRLRHSDFCEEKLTAISGPCVVSREKAEVGNAIDSRFASMLWGATIHPAKDSGILDDPSRSFVPAYYYNLSADVCSGLEAATDDFVYDFVDFANGSGSHLVAISCQFVSGMVQPVRVQFFSQVSGIRTH
jgi:hypothetical protein